MRFFAIMQIMRSELSYVISHGRIIPETLHLEKFSISAHLDMSEEKRCHYYKHFLSLPKGSSH